MGSAPLSGFGVGHYGTGSVCQPLGHGNTPHLTLMSCLAAAQGGCTVSVLLAEPDQAPQPDLLLQRAPLPKPSKVAFLSFRSIGISGDDFTHLFIIIRLL